MVIANTTSTSSTSTSTNAPVPQIQEQSAEGVDQALENIVDANRDFRVGAFENEQQLAEAIKLTLSLCEQTKPLLDHARHCGDARQQDTSQNIMMQSIKEALSTLMKFQHAQSATAIPTAKKAKKGTAVWTVYLMATACPVRYINTGHRLMTCVEEIVYYESIHTKGYMPPDLCR